MDVVPGEILVLLIGLLASREPPPYETSSAAFNLFFNEMLIVAYDGRPADFS